MREGDRKRARGERERFVRKEKRTKKKRKRDLAVNRCCLFEFAALKLARLIRVQWREILD
jgi:hypothetical protein